MTIRSTGAIETSNAKTASTFSASINTASSTPSAANILSTHASLLRAACQDNDKRLVTRILHGFSSLRRQLSSTVLLAAASEVKKDVDVGQSQVLQQIIQLLQPSSSSPPTGDTAPITTFTYCPAIEGYLAFLVAVYLLQPKGAPASQKPPSLVVALLELAITHMEAINVRALDPLVARCYYFLGRAHEAAGSLPGAHAYLMLAFRATRLRHDLESHATIYNLLLRTLLYLTPRYETAQQLVRQAPFPGLAENDNRESNSSEPRAQPPPITAGAAPLSGPSSSPSSSALSPGSLMRSPISGANQARYHYYVAYLRALQAEYGPAEEHLQAALRKAPHGALAVGFLQTVHQLLVVVQLLRGEIPARVLFRTPGLAPALHAYFPLTQAVQAGDTTRFQAILADQEKRFAGDRTLPLVRRLHQNVLKAGLKRLATAYSRLPLADVATKLGLPSVEDAAFVLMKALKEGVIEGRVEWEGGEGHLASGVKPVAYYTRQPQEAFHERILRLDALHNESLRGMRFSSAELKRAAAGGSGAANKKDGNGGPTTEAELLEEYMDAEDFM